MLIPIREAASRLHPAVPGKRYMAMLWLYCDESYDSKKDPKTFAIGGFLANERVWGKIERPWRIKNERVGVSRFHSAEINARDGEFEGWTKTQRDRYVKHMLRILRNRGTDLLGIGCGVHWDDYRKTINEHGRMALGHPYILCFKTCLLIMAKILRAVNPDLQFSVILDQNEWQTEAVDIFYRLKNDQEVVGIGKYLGTCTPGTWQEFVALQPADIIAYETYRLVHSRRSAEYARIALKKLLESIPMTGVYFDITALTAIKNGSEGSMCGANGYFPIFNNFEPNL